MLDTKCTCNTDELPSMIVISATVDPVTMTAALEIDYLCEDCGRMWSQSVTTTIDSKQQEAA